MIRCLTPRGVQPALVLALVFLSSLPGAGWVGSACADDDSEAPALFSRELMPGLAVTIGPDGALVLRHQAFADPLLQAWVPAVDDHFRLRTRRPVEPPFSALLSEGAPGGNRGFSAGADDDGDGAIDEDTLDNIDNDGDGLTDEDFAAIGNEMTVVHRLEGAGSVHLESYHWTSSGLRSAVFLGAAALHSELSTLQVSSSQGCWIETDITGVRHTVTGRPVAHTNHPFVTRIDLPNSTGAGKVLWLAVMVLGDHPGYLALGDEGGCELGFPLEDQTLPLVVCAAPTWLQLTATLTQAQLTYRGMSDPLSSRTAHWIVPPECPQCRVTAVPAFSYRPAGDRELVLRMEVDQGVAFRVDPDFFTLGGLPLGSPDKVTWLPAEGATVSLDWRPVTPEDLRDRGVSPGSPYVRFGLLEKHGRPGVVEFTFTRPAGAAQPADGVLQGATIGGRAFQTEATPLLVQVPAETFQGALVAGPLDADQAFSPEQTRQSLEADHRPPTLSPDLLEGWPNPFRDVIQVRFKVPTTVGEAFVWADGDDLPDTLDKQAAVPWNGGMPSASVKIYNINGQELVTIYSGSATAGAFTASWNGTDAYGRQVASGTYFCKLQLDDWSVTRRIVYLR